MSSFKQIASLAAVVAALGLVAQAIPVSAQVYNGGVAEVSVANGSVVIIRGDSGAQVAAAVNAPLVPGDYLSTGSGSSAEVQFDGASMLRLASNSQVRFVNLGSGSREVQLGGGTVDLAALQGSADGAQVDTPSLTVRPNQSGDYRISLGGNGQTLVTVRSGSATISTGQGSRTLTAGSTLVAYGPYNNPSISMQGALGFDSFDQFNMSRDQSIQSAYNSSPYLSPQLAGYSNLGNYGQWQNVPGYGWAWAPNNQSSSNFAPYQNGQWVWEPGSGYTWVDNSPYGYTTTHYGSWFNNSQYGGWLWQPPAYQDQTTSSALASAWLPAVVSFFLTGGSGMDLSSLLNGFIGLNGAGAYGNNTSLGWIPLAPGEPYQPWYGTNYSFPQTELTSVPTSTNIYNYYTNARYYGGVTTIPVSAWRAGNFSHYTPLRATQLHSVYLIRGAVPVVPTTANLHYTTARVSRPVTIARTFSTARFAERAPAITHTSFTAQQARIRAIAVVKPKVVPLTHHTVSRPVYQPVKRAPVHVTAMKPVVHKAAPQTHAAPKATSETKPAPKPAAKPAVHRAATPVPHHAPAAKPATHAAAPTAKPATHKAATPKPVVHKAAPAKPVVHATPHPKPVVHETAPVAKPVVKPVTHPAPVAKPVVHEAAPPVEKPVTRPAPEAKPVTHAPAAPVTHPAPATKPVKPAPAEKPAPKTEEKPVKPTPQPA